MKATIVLKIMLKIIVLALAALLGWIVYSGNAIYQYGVINEMRTVDAIVVLGAGVSNGEPSPVFRSRIDHGIWLYDNGYGKKLIFTGGKRSNSHETDAAVARRYAENQGVFPQDILVETQSRTTEENIANAKLVARRAGLRSLIIVSDPLHMKRAMLIAGDQHLKAYSSPTPKSRYLGWKSKLTFLVREVYFCTKYLLTRLGRKYFYTISGVKFTE
jgi:uncharacterized SAM-binding protein YcdF (DUF218 family)